MAAKQAMKENLQCTSKYGHFRISQDICHRRMIDIEGFLIIYGHSGNLLNNKYVCRCRRLRSHPIIMMMMMMTMVVMTTNVIIITLAPYVQHLL